MFAKRFFLTVSLAAIGLSALAANGATAAALTGYTLGDDGSTLVRFDVNTLAVTGTIALSGDNTRLSAIDFRPATGVLFGYDQATAEVYTVDLDTGMLTRADLDPVIPTTGAGIDIDFNPTVDRFRIVTSNEDNLVFDPATRLTTRTTNLFYNPADPGLVGVNPNIVANAYTNNLGSNLGGTTTQFALDSDLDALVTLANNAGTLTFVALLNLDLGAAGMMRVDLSEVTAFDIFTDAATGMNFAYVLADIGQGPDLFLLDLATGVMTTGPGRLTGDFGVLRGLAITTRVPVPAALPLMIGGLALVAVAGRRTRNG